MIRFLMLALGLFVHSVSALAQTPATEPTVTLAFVGDLMLDDTPGKVIKQGRDPLRRVAAMLQSADLRIGNLECVVATTGSPEPGKNFTLRAHPRSVNILKRHIDIVSLANNHSGDFGQQAFTQMLDLLDRNGIPYIGGGRTLAEAHRPLLIERKGVRIAFLAYNEFLPRSFEADYDQAGVAWSEDEQVRLDIALARSRHRADIVIPFMHWGWENEAVANPRQRQLARLLIDAGADAVVGSHPHVTQDIEIIGGKPVIYSLGNFVFDSFTREDNNTGWLLKMDVSRNGVREWRIDEVRIDKEGLPFPAPRSKSRCWQQGMESAVACPMQSH